MTRHSTRYEQLLRAKEKEGDREASLYDPHIKDRKFGTVGAVALDQFGNIAAATSTGGMTNKRYGRVGDAPIIGAGTYANNATCGVSSTGHGEYFIRLAVARDIASLMEYTGVSLREVADKVIHEKLQNLGGDGGIVALDREGNISMTFNSERMYRGFIKNQRRREDVYLQRRKVIGIQLKQHVMELVSGFLLWTADVMGAKWIRKEKNTGKKVLKALAYLVAGFAVVVVAFTLLY